MVLEIFEPVCNDGATVRYKDLEVSKLEFEDDTRCLWKVTHDEKRVETIDVAAFRSAGELARFLEGLAADEVPERVDLCGSCPVNSIPSD
ncbi:hypothetical protein HTZ84_22115 [Haloterrigena sp. SYSU A558-1]|uniref:Uncharacterized protein n=1 Tax=Haloterrigena gelatinilytica TaxID=2741724 RepID=A0ABX2LJA6_9EURY|nr:hypothetical protein [Haloterrigena gelatinilytica]NUC74963.1 hypothetical protein [Haloterrigena gelatinilytica]